MIFDCDTHMSPYRNHEKAMDAGELNARFEEAGIDRALTWMMPQGVTDVSESNAYVYESAKKYPRFYPFGWVNPSEGVEKAIRDAKTCLLDYGFRGIKFNGVQGKYYLDSDDTMAVAEAVAKAGGIIAFHTGAEAEGYTAVSRSARVIDAFPETTFLLIHMGGAGKPDRSDEVIGMAKTHPNVFLVGSEIDVSKVKNAIDLLGGDRVLFASDTPFSNTEKALGDYRAMLSDYGDAIRDQVFYQNAVRVFGL